MRTADQDLKDSFLASISKAADKASEGHYLDRAIAISQAFDLVYTDLLKAHRKFLDGNFKPPGLDQLLYEVTETVLVFAERYGVNETELVPIAWGLDDQALKDMGWYDDGRPHGTDAQRSDNG